MSKCEKCKISKTAGLLTILAGILHLGVVSIEHISPFPPLETIYFTTAGLAQIYVGYKFFTGISKKHFLIGAAVNGGIATLWILTRHLRAPFQAGPEHFDTLGIFVTVIELLAIGLTIHSLQKSTHRLKSLFHPILMALVLTILSGSANYGSALAMENVFPYREFNHHAEEPGHDDPPKPQEEITQQINDNAVEENSDSHSGSTKIDTTVEDIEDDHADDGHGH